MRNILFNEILMRSEFGSALFAVKELTDWVANKHFHLPKIVNLDKVDFIQVEFLLSEISTSANSLSESEALRIVQADNKLSAHWSSFITPVYAIGSMSANNWRILLNKAIEVGELTLLDYGSKLPLSSLKPAAVITSLLSETKPAKRKDLLFASIRLAQNQCEPANRFNAAEVFFKLRVMASNELAPFIGISNEGLKWLDSNDEPNFLSLKNLRARLDRQKKTRQDSL